MFSTTTTTTTTYCNVISLQQLDDQEFAAKQAEVQYEKKIKQLKARLDEAQSESGSAGWFQLLKR